MPLYGSAMADARSMDCSKASIAKKAVFNYKKNRL